MGSVEVEIMATTSRASCKIVEDVEIFLVLEESTDSDVTIFSSEEEDEMNPTVTKMDNSITILK